MNYLDEIDKLLKERPDMKPWHDDLCRMLDNATDIAAKEQIFKEIAKDLREQLLDSLNGLKENLEVFNREVKKLKEEK